MQKIIAVLLLFVGVEIFATYQVGDTIPNFCWNTVNETKFCVDDAKETVRVLVYNAGWCPPCNAEMEELAPKVSEFQGKPVTFISLSTAGWVKYSPADVPFLREWRDRYKIPFTVAAAPSSEMYQFFTQPRIPNVAILRKDGKLAYKAIGASPETIFSQVRRLLGE
ncbi:MAG: TlpA family protein disulfide reductase [Deltaproteobacteria bacterium]|nr:TlpA family protein disulfide reductase [Deltaproteobacteria bacterium]